VPIRPMPSLTRSLVSGLKCFSGRMARSTIPRSVPPKMHANTMPLMAKELISRSDHNNGRAWPAGASAPRGALARHNPLPSVVGLDHVLDLLLHRLQVKGGRVLHRRVVDGRLGEFRHLLLDEDKPPELSGVEVVAVAERTGQRGFPRERRES